MLRLILPYAQVKLGYLPSRVSVSLGRQMVQIVREG